MTYRLAMLIDAPATLHPATDSSLSILLEAQKRGYDCFIFSQRDIYLKDGHVFAIAQQGHVDLEQAPYFSVTSSQRMDLTQMDVIFIRLDPPFNREYLYMTYLLDLVVAQGTLVLNHPTSIRRYNEKIFASHFPAFTPPTLISANLTLLTEFIDEHQRVVIKPIDAMGGRGIVIIQHDDLDKNSLLDILTENQQKTVLAQRFLAEVKQGDKRILLINGEPVTQALLRTPAPSEFRANLAAGGQGTAVALTAQDLAICAALKPHLQAAHLFFVGIDVIGDYLTEINVTCPTGAVVLERLTDLKIFSTLFDALEKLMR